MSAGSSLAEVLGSYAERYAATRGWAVVPIHRMARTVRPTGVVMACSCGDDECLSPGKHAAIDLDNAYIEADFGPGGRVDADGGWGEHNVAVACGSRSGVVAFNIQPGAGEESWKRLIETEVGGDMGLVGTLAIATGGGGRIMLYSTAYGLVIDANRLELDAYPGVSALGDGAYVILPPSTHPSGTEYKFDHGMSAKSPLVPLPSGLLIKLVEEGSLAALAGTGGLSALVDNDDPFIAGRVARSLSDLGNSRRLVDHNPTTMAYTEGIGWRAWLNYRWTDRLVETGWIRNRAEELPKIIADERRRLEAKRIAKPEAEMTQAEKTSADLLEKRIKSLRAHEQTSRSDAKINAAVRRAQSDPRILRAPETWDRDPLLFVVANGVIDLETGALRPMERGLWISKYGNIAYEPEASKRTTCPEFWDFIGFITSNDEEYAEYLQHWAGYSLTGSMREKALIFCQGVGNTGKTTFADAMLGITGDYGLTVDNRLVSKEDRSGNIETSTTMLIGKRFAVAPDIPTNDFNADFLKKIAGGDELTGRRMQQNSISFISPAKLWIFSNHFPNIRDKQLMERMRVLPFSNQSTDRNRSRSLWTKPETWVDGIGGVGANHMMRAMLDWAVVGARKNLALGAMPACAVAEKAKAEYETTGDAIFPFVRERCRVGEELSIELNALYREYDAWIMETKFSRSTASRGAFHNMLAERGFPVTTGIDGVQMVAGITVKPTALPAYLRPAGLA